MRILDSLPPERRGRPSVLAPYTDGKVYEIDLVKDIPCRSVNIFRAWCRNYARRNGMQAFVRKTGERTVALQILPEGSQPRVQSRKKPAGGRALRSRLRKAVRTGNNYRKARQRTVAASTSSAE